MLTSVTQRVLRLASDYSKDIASLNYDKLMLKLIDPFMVFEVPLQTIIIYENRIRNRVCTEIVS